MSAREHRLLLFAVITVLLCAMITAVFGAWPCLAAAQPQELPAMIATLGGRAELSRKSGPWAAAALRDELSAGDAVRTIGGRLTVLTASGQALRLGARTQIVFAGRRCTGDAEPHAPAHGWRPALGGRDAEQPDLHPHRGARGTRDRHRPRRRGHHRRRTRTAPFSWPSITEG